MMEGKAFVTGGATGIGFACAKKLVEYGAEVVICSRNEKNLQKAVEELGEEHASYFAADVTSWDQMEQAVSYAVEKMGRLDYAVNCAGARNPKAGHVYDYVDHEAWTYTIDLCLHGVFHPMRFELPQMIKQNGGSIVNISSLNGIVPYYRIANYCAAKGGVNMLTEVAAMEVGKYNVRVNSVMPGFIGTVATNEFKNMPEAYEEVMSRSPLNRFGEPEEVAEAVAFLLSDKASFITGTNILVDGGMANYGYPDVRRALDGEEKWRELYK